MKLTFTFLLGLILFSSCEDFNKSYTTLDTPFDNAEFQFGDTIIFTGRMISPVLQFDQGFLKVTELESGSVLLNAEFSSDYAFMMVNQASDTSTLEIQLTKLIEDAKEKEILKTIHVTCYPQ